MTFRAPPCIWFERRVERLALPLNTGTSRVQILVSRRDILNENFACFLQYLPQTSGTIPQIKPQLSFSHIGIFQNCY